MVNTYAIEFQAALRKVDRQQTTLRESIVNDFLAGLDPNISVMVYAFAPVTLEDAIQKAKMVEQGQKNATQALTANHMVATLQQQNQVLQQQVEQKSQNLGKPQQSNWKPKPKPYNQRDGRNRGSGKGNNPNWNRPRNNPSNNNNRQNNNRKPNNGNCYKCGKSGHIARHCQSTNRVNYVSQEEQRQLEEEWSSEEEEDLEETTINLHQNKDKPKSNLRKGSSYEYNVVKDMFWTMSNATYGDLMKDKKYRKPVMEALEELDNDDKNRVNNIQQREEMPIYRSYVKIGKTDLQATWDSGAQKSTITEPLAKLLNITWDTNKRSRVKTIDGTKNPTLGTIT